MLLLKALALLVILVQFSDAQKMVGYYTNWAQYRPDGGKFFPEDIDPKLLTHIVFAFANMANGQMVEYEWNDDQIIPRMMALKNQNPALKVLIAVGGWNMGSTPFTNMVANDNNINNFVTTSIAFMRKYKFDGLDLDWEYPGANGSPASDKQRFTVLCQRLRTAFDATPEKFLLTAAVAAGKGNIDSGYEIPQIKNYLHFINVMTYDYHGAWELLTGANAPLYPRPGMSQPDYHCSFTLPYYEANGLGFAPDQIIFGMGTYGRTWTLTSTLNTGMGAPASGAGTAGTWTREAGFKAYYEICQHLSQGWTQSYHPDHQVPYAHSGNQWVSYDNFQSLRVKVDYLKQRRYGGAMFWALDLDDFTGNYCNSGKYPLINYVKSLLDGGVVTEPTQGSTTTTQPGQTTTTTTGPVGSCGNCAGVAGITRFMGCPPCREFFRCVNGVPQILSCSPGTLFNNNIESCDHDNGHINLSTCNQN